MSALLELLNNKLKPHENAQDPLALGVSYTVQPMPHYMRSHLGHHYEHFLATGCQDEKDGKGGRFQLEVKEVKDEGTALRLSRKHQYISLLFFADSEPGKATLSLDQSLVQLSWGATRVLPLKQGLAVWESYTGAPKILADFLLYLFDLDETVFLA